MEKREGRGFEGEEERDERAVIERDSRPISQPLTRHLLIRQDGSMWWRTILLLHDDKTRKILKTTKQFHAYVIQFRITPLSLSLVCLMSSLPIFISIHPNIPDGPSTKHAHYPRFYE